MRGYRELPKVTQQFLSKLQILTHGDMMLQTNQPVLAADQEASSRTSSPAEMVATLLGFLRRHYAIMLTAILLATAIATVYIFTTPPAFTAKSSIVLDPRKIQVFQDPPILGEMNLNSIGLENQLRLLKSDNVALAVIQNLRLTEDPEFVGSKGMLKDLLSTFPFLNVFRSAGPQPSETEQTEALLRAFQKRLTLTRLPGSSVIEIKFQSTDPQRAAQIANAVGEAYIAGQLGVRRQAADVAVDWLQNRLPDLHAKRLEAERAIVDFKAKNKIVAADGRLMDEQQIADLNRELVTARARTSEARARLDRIKAVLQGYAAGSTNTATVNDTLSNPIITPLRSKYLDYVNREADFSARYGRDHQAAVKLRRQIDEIRKSILDELRRIAESYKSNYEIEKQQQASLEKALDETVAQSQIIKQAQVKLSELESTAHRYRALDDTFLQRYREVIQQQSGPITEEARFISRASKPLAPSGPRKSLILALAVAGGLAFGVGVGALREMMDRAFRTSRQVQSVLHTDCIALLPKVVDRRRPMKLLGSTRTSGSQIISPNSKTNAIWTVLDSPLSRFSESLRSLKVSLNERSRSSKIVAVTSALPGEGKSTVAASFALMLAQEGARVMLVDCDLRTASLSRLLTGRTTCGILDVIADKKPLKDAIWKEPCTNLAFLPAGIKSQLACSSNVLYSEAAQNFFDHLRQAYEYIIVDLPPVGPVVDVRSTAQFVDFYTLVIEWGRTQIDLVEHAISAAPAVYEHLLGVVLNKVDIDLLATYEGSRRKYYLNKQYASYGFID